MSLIVHPEVKKLKEKLSQLIFEYDNLVNHICPEIERLYVLEFGRYEHKLYKIELEIDKLKRKIQLIRIEINHENEINVNKIDDIIKKEFEEYEKQIQAQIDEIKFLEENDVEKLSPEDSKKFKKLYHMLIKRLHPDLHPNQTFLELNLFYRAVYCFENGDLKGLESVAAILPDEEFEELSEIDHLENLVNEYEEKIEKVKKDYPYNKKGLLDNGAGEEYKIMLLELISDRKETVKQLEEKINGLIENG
ncbi:hypothetical protein [Methanobrevibacter sp.]|uniref:hypothetical protein n=1 Tax=Methanobrevibacter sp. TaxID=66852 RepID=UPI003890561E